MSTYMSMYKVAFHTCCKYSINPEISTTYFRSMSTNKRKHNQNTTHRTNSILRLGFQIFPSTSISLQNRNLLTVILCSNSSCVLDNGSSPWLQYSRKYLLSETFKQFTGPNQVSTIYIPSVINKESNKTAFSSVSIIFALQCSEEVLKYCMLITGALNELYLSCIPINLLTPYYTDNNHHDTRLNQFPGYELNAHAIDSNSSSIYRTIVPVWLCVRGYAVCI